MRKLVILAATASIFLSGCATIVGDETQLVQINSDPVNANFVIKNDSGKTIVQGKTPQGVTLAKSDGSYFGKQNYQVTFSKEGYQPTTLPIRASANGWYIGGNFLFGGLVGWLIVDPLNGGMYTLKPKEVNSMLSATK